MKIISSHDTAVVTASATPAHEAIDKFNRSVANWGAPFLSADREILPEKMAIDVRVRDLNRNEPLIAGASKFYRNSIVGTNYKLIAAPKHEYLGKDREWAKTFKKEVETKFMLWANSPDNWVDMGRRNNLTSFLRSAVASYFLSGEVLAVAEWDRSIARPYKTCLSLVDPDRLVEPILPGYDEKIRGGIRLDAHGKPVEYFIRNTHPAGMELRNNYDYKAIKAYKSWGRIQVIHLYDKNRPEQSRGVSALTSALKEVKMLHKLKETLLQNSIVRSMYAAVITSDMPAEAVFSQLGANDSETTLEGYYNGYLSILNEYVESSRNLNIDGVKIPHLFPGTKLDILSPGEGGPLGTDFETSLIRNLACALGISYEQLSKDYRQSSYSSARAGMLETWKNMQAIKTEITDTLASHIYRLWLEEAILAGEIKSFPNSDLFYEAMNKDALTNCSWIGASQGQIDELNEGQAAHLRIQGLVSSRQIECAAQGRDWDDVLMQAEEEKTQLDEAGLQPEQSNMMNSVVGKTGQVEDPKNGTNKPN